MSDHDNWLKEAQAFVSGGVSSAFDPEYIKQDQASWARNTSFRNGKMNPRMRLAQRAELPDGLIQGVDYFSKSNGMIVVMAGGLLYRIKPTSSTTFTLQDVELDFPNSPQLHEVWMQECTSSIVIQNGLDSPILYNGADAVHALKNNQIGVGTQMAFANGRVWYHNGHGRLYAGNVAGTATDSELVFTETTYFTGGGYFAFTECRCCWNGIFTYE